MYVHCFILLCNTAVKFRCTGITLYVLKLHEGVFFVHVHVLYVHVHKCVFKYTLACICMHLQYAFQSTVHTCNESTVHNECTCTCIIMNKHVSFFSFYGVVVVVGEACNRVTDYGAQYPNPQPRSSSLRAPSVNLGLSYYIAGGWDDMSEIPDNFNVGGGGSTTATRLGREETYSNPSLSRESKYCILALVYLDSGVPGVSRPLLITLVYCMLFLSYLCNANFKINALTRVILVQFHPKQTNDGKQTKTTQTSNIVHVQVIRKNKHLQIFTRIFPNIIFG